MIRMCMHIHNVWLIFLFKKSKSSAISNWLSSFHFQVRGKVLFIFYCSRKIVKTDILQQNAVKGRQNWTNNAVCYYLQLIASNLQVPIIVHLTAAFGFVSFTTSIFFRFAFHFRLHIVQLCNIILQLEWRWEMANFRNQYVFENILFLPVNVQIFTDQCSVVITKILYKPDI